MEMTLLHFSLKLFEILRYLKILQSHSRGGLLMPLGPAVNLKEGMCNLFLFPMDITKVRIDHFLKPVTDKGLGKSLNMY